MSGLVARDVIDQVRNALDIADVIGSYIQLKRTGQTAKALCPFHKEKTPSFHVNSARQAFHCFGCGAGGDLFKFVMLYENVDFPTALRMMADRAGVVLQFEEKSAHAKGGPAKDDLFKANEEASQRYQKELRQSPDAAAARAYLEGRALPQDVWKEWGIGYAPDQWGFLADSSGPRGGPKVQAMAAAGLLVDNEKGHFYDRFRGRVMFTIRDELGRTVGFSGRLLKPDEKGAGKYVNTPETPAFRKSRILFGLDKARRPIRDHRCVILCEGQIDCIRCHLGGFSNTVASQGTAITNEHATLLRRYADEVIIVLDADTAGQKAALRTAELMLAEGFAVQLAALPPGEDPDSLIVNQGPEAFAAVLEAALSPMNFLIGTLRAQPDWQTQAGLARATRAALELAGHAQSAVQAEQMLREAAAGLNVGFRSLQSDLRRIQRQKYRPTPATEPSAPPPPAVERPADELELAQLLGTHSDPELTGLVRQWLRYDLITDADCRAVIRAIAEEETDLMAALDEESDVCKTFAAQVVNAPQKIVGEEPEADVLKAAQDLIARIWQRHLEARRQELGRTLAHASGEKRSAVLQEFAELLLDQKKVLAGWEQAQAIIEIYLQRLDG